MIPLSKVAHIVMGQSPLGKDCSHEIIGLPLLNGPTEFGTHSPHPAQWTSNPKRCAQKGDILFCVRGSTTGRMNWADQTYAIGRGIAAIRHKEGIIYQPWLKAIIEWQLSEILIAATGSTFPNVSKELLYKLNIPNHSLPEQREIAAILSALDDKIENNRKTTATLEEMARALYRSWFVDFDPVHARAEGRAPAHMDAATATLFPDRFGEDGLPEGWDLGRVKDIFDINMGQSPPGDTYNLSFIGLPFYQGRSDFGLRFPSIRKYCSAPKKIAEKNEILLSVRAPVGDMNRATEKCCIGRGLASLSEKKERNAYGYQAILASSPHLKNFDSEGTVFGAINKKELSELPLLRPGDSLIDLFEAHILPIDEKIRALFEQSQTLATLRDTLLPRLMSGELRVSEAKEMVEEASS